jgi:hypothetical protein
MDRYFTNFADAISIRREGGECGISRCYKPLEWKVGKRRRGRDSLVSIFENLNGFIIPRPDSFDSIPSKDFFHGFFNPWRKGSNRGCRTLTPSMQILKPSVGDVGRYGGLIERSMLNSLSVLDSTYLETVLAAWYSPTSPVSLSTSSSSYSRRATPSTQIVALMPGRESRTAIVVGMIRGTECGLMPGTPMTE